jgi:N-methylhydantoinase A
MLLVGPQSAGAVPGPAAYGRGGTLATVTDAHVVLGHLPAELLGGRMALDLPAARAVVQDTIALPLGMALEDAARGILAIIDNHMVGALRIVSVERGHDPRDFTLVPFGGAGPLHGCSLAELLGVERIMVPPAPGVLCADGLLVADLKAEFSRTLPKAGAADAAVADAILSELSAQADAWFETEDVAPQMRRQARVALMRYHGQGGEIMVPWTGTAAEAETAFAAAHEALYGFRLDSPVELVTLRVEATGRMPQPARVTLPPGSGARPSGTLTVALLSGATEIPFYDRATLGAGDGFAGPAIVSQLDATTLVRPGWTALVHESGAILLTRAKERA